MVEGLEERTAVFGADMVREKEVYMIAYGKGESPWSRHKQLKQRKSVTELKLV